MLVIKKPWHSNGGQEYNQYIKPIWKVSWFVQEETLECECGLGWAIINLENVGQAHCKSVITSFFQNTR